MLINKTEGIFHHTKRGKDYATIKNGNKIENIPLIVSYNSDVYDGDEVALLIQTENGTRLGKVTKVLSRARTTVVGEYCEINKKAYVLPDSYLTFRVQVKHESGEPHCENGDKILATINKYKALSAIRVTPVRNFGRADTYFANLRAAVADTPHFSPFPAAAERAALEVKPVDARNCVQKRLDLRSKPVFTFTDSVFESNGVGFSVAVIDGGWRVGIHTVDVAEYITPGSVLDTEAAKRGRQILRGYEASPMLPPSVLASACTFTEKSENLAVSYFITYDQAGNVLDTDIDESVVTPVMTAAASDLDVLIAARDMSALMPLRIKYAAIAEQIEALYALAGVLRAKRIKEGGLDFDSCARVFGLDSERRIKAMSCEYKGDSALMIQEILVSAGSALGEKLFYAGVPCVYSGLTERVFDSVVGTPDECSLLNEKEYYKPGYTKHETNVSRGTFYEKNCFERITLECDNPELAFAPLKHYVYGFYKYAEMFSPASRYSDLVNQRAVKAWKNDEAYDVSKSAEAIQNQRAAGEVSGRLNRIMEIAFLSDGKARGKTFNGTVLKQLQDGVSVLLECGAIGVLPKVGDTVPEVGEKVTVKVADTNYVNAKIVFTAATEK